MGHRHALCTLLFAFVQEDLYQLWTCTTWMACLASPTTCRRNSWRPKRYMQEWRRFYPTSSLQVATANGNSHHQHSHCTKSAISPCCASCRIGQRSFAVVRFMSNLSTTSSDSSQAQAQPYWVFPALAQALISTRPSKANEHQMEAGCLQPLQHTQKISAGIISHA
jgi:hypothetical protein